MYASARYLAPGYFAPRYFGTGVEATAPLPLDLAQAVADRIHAALVLADPPLATRAAIGLAPADTPLPYLAVEEPDENSTQVGTDGTFIAAGQIQLQAFAGDRPGARGLADRAEAALRSAPLAFAAGNLMVLRRASRTLELDPDPAPGGGDCWMERRMYEFRYSYQP